ncbi:hypothetical protein LTR78_006713 [Recurvomyces mirabilis]|uniref:Uncharacterized protein n=1 Tax=Recurvomyces mirabilis TaxID=574656 RepID=A0AAE1BZV4_9PEZI|nr:hypothetical protein LTR78_006713 [Recurvomyces mirabilis]KAK5151398.1 hypothetical protein LTS14_009241 [Recurvomyces mirabilis]
MAMSTSPSKAQASASASIMLGYQNRSSSRAQEVTAVYKNMTLTSPTVYIDFQTAYATDDCGNAVGKAYPGAVVGVDPQSLYSMLGDWDFAVQTVDNGARTTTFYPSAKFDFHDLNGLPPVSAYIEQPSCIAYGCYSIWSSLYRPVLVLPSQVRNLDPAWKSCGLDWHGAWDPPIALQPAQAIDPVTTPHAPSYTVPASPQSTIRAPASQTPTAIPADPRASISQGGGALHTPASTDPLESEKPVQSSTSNKAWPSSADPSLVGISLISTQTSPEIPTSFSYRPVQTADDPASRSGVVLASPSIVPALSSSSTLVHFPSATNAYEVLTAAQGTAISSIAASRDDPGSSGSIAPPATSSQGVLSVSLLATSSASTIGGGQTLSAVPVVAPDGGTSRLLSFAGTTVSEGGPALSTAGHSYSAVSGEIIEDGSTVELATKTLSKTSTPQAAITIGTSTAVVHSVPGGGVLLGTQTLLSGSGVLIDGHTLSAGSNGIVQDGTTIPFSIPSSTLSTQAPEAILTLSSAFATASEIPGSYIAWAIGIQTLSVGEPGITMGGHSVSAAPSGVLLEDGTVAEVASSSSSSVVQSPSSPSGFLPVITTASGATPTEQGSATSSTAATGSGIVSSSGSAIRNSCLRILLLTPVLLMLGCLFGVWT